MENKTKTIGTYDIPKYGDNTTLNSYFNTTQPYNWEEIKINPLSKGYTSNKYYNGYNPEEIQKLLKFWEDYEKSLFKTDYSYLSDLLDKLKIN